MAKAELTLPDGTQVKVDGTAEEVAALLEMYASRASVNAPKKGSRANKPRPQTTRPNAKNKGKKAGISELVRELKTDNFFKSKRTIGEVRKELETRGHIYPVTSLSGPLLALVRSRELGRIKEEKVWKYVHR